MPYARRFKRSFSRRRFGGSRRRGMHVPRIPNRDKMMIRMQSAGMDVKPTRFRTSATKVYTFATGLAAPQTHNTVGQAYNYIQPLVDFVGSTDYTSYVAPMYNEYRIVKVTISCALKYADIVTSTVNGFAGTCPQLGQGNASSTYCATFGQSWIRSSTYASPPDFVSFTQIINLPDGKIKHITPYGPFESYSSITADGASEKNWLQTKVTPNNNPNYEYWCPCWCSCIDLGTECASIVTHNTIGMATTVTYVVECRGTKCTASY